MESPSKEPPSWVDNYIKQNRNNILSENIVRPTLRVRRYDFPSEFEELYSRFVAMLLVLDPRIFLNVMDDCFRDTVDVMNDPRLQQKLNEYLALRSENYYNMNDINGVTTSPLSRHNNSNGGKYRRRNKDGKKSVYNTTPANNQYNRGLHFIDYDSPLNSNNPKTRLRPASAGSGRRRRRKSPTTPKSQKKKSEYGQVQFNTDIKYGDWMKERSQLKEEKKILEEQIETMKKDSMVKVRAQNKLSDVMDAKIIELQNEINLLKEKLNQ